MKLTDYARILIRRGWIMLLVALIAGFSAYYFSKQQTPVYRATQKVLLLPSRSDLSLTESNRSLLETYAVYLNSSLRAQEVIDTLHLERIAGELMSHVTIASDKYRMVIQIDVEDRDGETAKQIAQAWGQILIDYRNEQNQLVRREDRIDPQLVDTPTYSQSAPRPQIMAVAGAILGLLVGGVIVFIMEYLESSVIRRDEDIERLINVPVLASIPDFE